MTMNDAWVPSLPVNEIENRSDAWREAFGIWEQYAPDILKIAEIDVAEIVPEYSLIVVNDVLLGDDAARTIFDPLGIIVAESVYEDARFGRVRARFTIAHELGHLFLHSGKSVARGVESTRKRVPVRSRSAEWQADKFAAAFLMPRHVATQFSSPEELAENCLVSEKAAKIRMKDLGILKERRELPDIVKMFLKERGKDV